MNNDNLQSVVPSPVLPTNVVGDNTINQNIEATPVPNVEVGQQNVVATPAPSVEVSQQNVVATPIPTVDVSQQNVVATPEMMASASYPVSSTNVLNTETNQVNSLINPVPSNMSNVVSDMTSPTLETTNTDISSQNMVSEVTTPDTSVVKTDTGIPVKRYLGYMFLYSIPCIGFVFLIMDAFVKKDTDIQNYAKAHFIFLLVILGFISIFYFIAAVVLKLNFAY